MNKNYLPKTPKDARSGSLFVNGISLMLALGVSEQERSHPQEIMLDLVIDYTTPPKSLESDDIADADCYDSIIKAVRDALAGQEFKLIEHLAYTIHGLVKGMLKSPCALGVKITKKPRIDNFAGSTSFIYRA